MSGSLRGRASLAALLLLLVGSPADAQNKVVTVTVEILERFLAASAAEKTEQESTSAEAAELDRKLKEYRNCVELLQAAGEIGGRVGGLAAKAVMRAKCGATSEDGFVKDRERLARRALEAALKAGKFKEAEYASLRDRLASYLGGYGEFGKDELAVLDARRSDLSASLGIAFASRVEPAGGPPGRSRRGGGLGQAWTTDYAWQYIGELFNVMYISGASIFEKPYEPGQWTRWEYRESWLEDERRVTERAFLARTEDGGEWWRVKTIEYYPGEDGKEVADTITLEALFKPQGEYVRELARVRGKFPGQAEPQELMVPQLWGMLNLLSAFPWQPTEESVKGATKGVGPVKTAAGEFEARHVVFGSGGGTIEWWLSDAAPGGWVKFQHVESDDEGKPYTWSLELVGHGGGATSELGVP